MYIIKCKYKNFLFKYKFKHNKSNSANYIDKLLRKEGYSVNIFFSCSYCDSNQ